jgi:hypothetical protein
VCVGGGRSVVPTAKRCGDARAKRRVCDNGKEEGEGEEE